MHCPLCRVGVGTNYCKDRQRYYWQCPHCTLVFVDKQFYLSEVAEKQLYDLHENSLDDPGYLKFLSRTYQPLLHQLKKPSIGLDFGCGPVPALAHVLTQHGHHVHCYDHFYAQDNNVWQHQYDFICTTEVVEHLQQPGEILHRLWSHLKVGGVLAIMTKLVINQTAFSQWHYKNDLSHICFFSETTFQWLADTWQASWQRVDKDVIFFWKNNVQ